MHRNLKRVLFVAIVASILFVAILGAGLFLWDRHLMAPITTKMEAFKAHRATMEQVSSVLGKPRVVFTSIGEIEKSLSAFGPEGRHHSAEVISAARTATTTVLYLPSAVVVYVYFDEKQQTLNYICFRN